MSWVSDGRSFVSGLFWGGADGGLLGDGVLMLDRTYGESTERAA